MSTYNTILLVSILAAVAVFLCLIRFKETPVETVLNRLQNGESQPSVFDGIPDGTVIEFAQGAYEQQGLTDLEYEAFCRAVRRSARAVLHRRGVQW